MHYIKGIYFWSVIVVLTIFVLPVIFMCQFYIIIFKKPRDGRLIHSLSNLWGTCVIKLTPGWSVEVRGREHLPKDGEPMVIVANHQSMADIWVACTLGLQFRWISKIEMFRIPIFGQAMRWAGYIEVDRGNRTSHIKAIQESESRLRQGISMFFFPEGTRSKTGELGPFKKGAFRLAKDLKVPVLPLLLEGTRDMMAKGSWIPGEAQVVIHVLPLIRAVDITETPEAFANRVRDFIVKAKK